MKLDRGSIAKNFWPARALRRALYSNLSGRLIAILWNNQIPSGGCRINTNNRSIRPETKARIFFGAYERAELLLLRRHIGHPTHVIDLGSSLGVVSSQAAACMPPGSQLICVEANPALIATLRQNIARNASHVSATVINAAIDYSGTPVAQIAIAEQHTATHVARGAEISVPATTLRAILSTMPEAPYALVMDIEGSEAGILKHDLDCLHTCTRIIAELHETASMSILQMCSILTEEANFHLLERRGNVFAFHRNGT